MLLPICARVLAVLSFFLFCATAQVLQSGVFEADDSNFEDVVFQKGTYSFVNFYSPSCTHCQQLAPNFHHLAHIYKDSKLNFVQINGLHNKRIRKQLKLIGFPLLRLYSSDGSHMASFKGSRSVENMVQFLIQNTGIYPDLSLIQKDQNERIGQSDEISSTNQKKLKTKDKPRGFYLNNLNNYANGEDIVDEDSSDTENDEYFKRMREL
ncbi:protein disulfide isomerase family protein [Ascoidea rubescens DSM 1968]|uniref:Thioredoxin-like protein n=1 Tax=Ascoidea rubescens DSM 1968 TaxID=1344418 RepID=A0A1D2VC45_9ASCO|nr:thioredoxin-like protein [Ascoidea rubescens DSM 1968]ODV59274.1 thioredoxin-like protein [Ascoidea rubescens DSM 1968]